MECEADEAEVEQERSEHSKTDQPPELNLENTQMEEQPDEDSLASDWSSEMHDQVTSPSMERRGCFRNPLGLRLENVLTRCQPYPGDPLGVDENNWSRFHISRDSEGFYEIYDKTRQSETYIHQTRIAHCLFSAGKWYAEWCAQDSGHVTPWHVAADWIYDKGIHFTLMGAAVEERVENLLEVGAPYTHEADLPPRIDKRFKVFISSDDQQHLHIIDSHREIISYLPKDLLDDYYFNVCDWYQSRLVQFDLDQQVVSLLSSFDGSSIPFIDDLLITDNPSVSVSSLEYMEETKSLMLSDNRSINLQAIQADRNKFHAVQRNSASVKSLTTLLPKTVVLKVQIQGHFARALIDSGSQGDFVSTTLADQLSLNKSQLNAPMKLQLAVQGSRSVINYGVEARFQFQNIDEVRTFHVINLNNYDVILGTPWLYQHQVCIGFNPARIMIGSDKSLPIKMGSEAKPLVNAIDITSNVDAAREELRRYAEPLCKDDKDTGLPPLRAINHSIPLIDEKKIYPWRPSRCPEVFRSQWAEKRDAYLKSGRWEITSAGNTVPMLLIQKPKRDAPELRIVVDLRERNKNTHKMTSPLPDMEGVLRRTAKHKYRTALDLKSAYEQIRIIPEHVSRTTVTTPDGNMVSHVVQQGDCNAPATYQALMNHLFSALIGRCMDVYLDDIIIYSDDLGQHIRDVKTVLDILSREKLYLSKSKLRFIAPEIELLGRIIDDNGIRMDPHKVDSVANWKTPTNRDLLRGFLGSVGYLADDIPNIRIPMGVLTSITGDTVPFRWTFTEQRAFEDIKHAVQATRDHRRTPLDYSEGASQIWMTTDGSATGISGLIGQGKDWKTAKVAAFYSAKLNPAQQNYPVHEIEMLASIETMLRHADILQGAKFKWVTDHKGLLHLLNQKNLSGRQARWLEKIASFQFEVIYVPGADNVLADALSRMYSNDFAPTVRARSEYTYHDIINDDMDIQVGPAPDMPVLEVAAAVPRQTRKKKEVLPAETGRPETSKEFAARVKNLFVLKGPRERKEGGSSTHNASPPKLIQDKPQDKPRNQECPKEDIPVPNPDNGDPKTAPVTFPSLPRMLSTSESGIDIIREIKGRYQEDQFFKKILDDPKSFRNFSVENSVIYLKEREKTLLCVPKIVVNGRNVREIIISEAHSILAHLGSHKTLDYLRDHVWWKDMVSDTHAYCETCVTCKRSKPSNQKPYGLLNPLSVPGRPWDSIGVDFVGPLPDSQNRNGTFNSITVVICLFSAMVHLIPSRDNYNAKQMAELMFEEVYKHHGIPRSIVSDRDVLFTSTFWERLHELIGTQLRMSSAYHPQTDGSTERANRTVTQMLRQCINEKQTDWVSKLPAIEFAINSA